MTMFVREERFEFRAAGSRERLFTQLQRACEQHLPEGAIVVRFVVTQSTASSYQCECGVLSGLAESGHPPIGPIFDFRPRLVENTGQFNSVLLIPTGIGAEIGGHAGDAGPVARLLAAVCDNLITHPNVVNASDVNETPDNGLYVEGSVISRFLMGTAGLQPVRSNRVLTVIDAHEDGLFVDAAVNTVNGGRAAYGLRCPEVIQLDPPVKMRALYSESGRAVGRVEQLDNLVEQLKEKRDHYDAVALSSVIKVPDEYHRDYYESEGSMVNPWGGVEAMLTHAISGLFNVPSAHAPMFESRNVANLDIGIVDPRMAAEAVSMTFLQCVLKGLHRSPRIVTDPQAMTQAGVLSAADVSCLVIPDGCLGLPTLAALEQGIPVIAVRENRNLMRNDLSELPWAPDQFYPVNNYWEAAGVIAALKAGVAPEAARRPFAGAKVSVTSKAQDAVADGAVSLSQGKAVQRRSR